MVGTTPATMCHEVLVCIISCEQWELCYPKKVRILCYSKFAFMSEAFSNGVSWGVNRDLPRAWASSKILRRALPKAVDPPLTDVSHIRDQICPKYAGTHLRNSRSTGKPYIVPRFYFKGSVDECLVFLRQVGMHMRSNFTIQKPSMQICFHKGDAFLSVLSVTMSNFNPSWARLTMVESTSKARDAFRNPGSWDLRITMHSRTSSETRGSWFWWTARGSLRLTI